MSESSSPQYRCVCPHCQKVLKVRAAWAGKRGACPQCMKAVDFPAFRPPAANSATTQQLLKLVAEEDEASLDDVQTERFALLLSQGTCVDYRMADKLLRGRAFSPRQWRRILNSADHREGMRLRLESRLEEGEPVDDPGEEPLALLAAAEAAAPNAWKIMSRFLYYQRHGACTGCEANPTGMECMYRTFEGLLEVREIPPARAKGWKALLHRHLGL